MLPKVRTGATGEPVIFKLINRLRENGHEHLTAGGRTVGTGAGSYEAVSVEGDRK